MTYTQHIAALALSIATLPAWAQTTVKDAWVRGTVAQQKATGAFLQITSTAGGKLLSVSSPVAGVVELHEMSMDGSTMKMRAVDAVELPAGKAVILKPGGLHVMLMDLKKPMADGDSVPLTLVVQGKDGKQETLQVQAKVKPLSTAAQGDMAGHKH